MNLFSTFGKFSFAKKQLTSSRSVYSQFTLPRTLIRGDVIDIPVSVFNNHQNTKSLTVTVNEYVLKPIQKTVAVVTKNVEVGAKSQV